MKDFIKKTIWNLGYDLVSERATSNPLKLMLDLIEYTKINQFIDVGANEGQSALELIRFYPHLPIHSFEPLSHAHETLLVNSKNHSQWRVYPRTALGETKGEIKIQIAGNSQSSSLLKMKQLHIDSAPESTPVGEELTSITRLDELLKNQPSTHRYYLKIDTQGSELAVLKGSTGILNQVQALQLELSWQELYQGQPLATEVLQWVLTQGFAPYGFSPVFRDKKTQALLQMDGFFLRIREV